MKLYYSPGTCSLAVHIALIMAGYKFELEKVDLTTKKTENNKDFFSINPKGYVPALQLDNNELLTEVAVILQYIADKNNKEEMIPKAPSLERYHFLELLNFIATEIHKSVSVMFSPAATAEFKACQIKVINKRFDTLNSMLNNRLYIYGNKFSVADGYLFTVLSWTKIVHIDLNTWPQIMSYFKHITTHPIIREAMTAEGLIK